MTLKINKGSDLKALLMPTLIQSLEAKDNGTIGTLLVLQSFANTTQTANALAELFENCAVPLIALANVWVEQVVANMSAYNPDSQEDSKSRQINTIIEQ